VLDTSQHGSTYLMLQTSTLPLSEEGSSTTWRWLSLRYQICCQSLLSLKLKLSLPSCLDPSFKTFTSCLEPVVHCPSLLPAAWTILGLPGCCPKIYGHSACCWEPLHSTRLFSEQTSCLLSLSICWLPCKQLTWLLVVALPRSDCIPSPPANCTSSCTGLLQTLTTLCGFSYLVGCLRALATGLSRGGCGCNPATCPLLLLTCDLCYLSLRPTSPSPTTSPRFLLDPSLARVHLQHPAPTSFLCWLATTRLLTSEPPFCGSRRLSFVAVDSSNSTHSFLHAQLHVSCSSHTDHLNHSSTT
jgi:hypothetical protein